MNSNSKPIQELSDGWVLCSSKSNPGRQYYFNRKTGKSSWTEPLTDNVPDNKVRKKEKERANQEKRRKNEARNKSVKRKSDGTCDTSGSMKKRQKNDTPQKPKGSPHKTENPKPLGTKSQQIRKTLSPTKRKTSDEITLKTTPSSNTSSPLKKTPKNAASNRLSNLRAQLSVEAKNEVEDSSPKKTRISPKPGTNDTPLSRPKTEVQFPNTSESVSSTPTKFLNDSLQSIPSPSQFYEANKIICSMKAQIPERFCNEEKPKNSFADIEHGICYQVTDSPVIKHPSTPPQFSEASKLVSAIKSKLAYTPTHTHKDVKTFKSAKERMESLQNSFNEDDLQSASISLISPQNIASRQNHTIASNSIQSPQNVFSLQNNITRQNYEAMEVEDIREVPLPCSPASSRSTKKPDDGQVVLVVDTNIFIHELSFIKDVLNSHIKGYSEQPMLLVPWRVINELDRLKDNNNGNGAICKRARAAMDYLYKSLPENNRIKGQSLRDSNSHIYPCELPDDEILNCALQQAERGRNVLLLSNDKNLCNKATVNGIKRMSIAELKLLVEHKPQVKVDPDLVANFKHYQQTIYQLLADILENEMRAKYNNLWQHVVFKTPPWQLGDVLQCLAKHWMAVFSDVFPRIEHLITDLRNTYTSIESKDPSTLTESEVANFKELCLDVGRKCQIIPEYMELAKLTVERLTRASETEDVRGRELVVGAFEGLWTVFSSYCAKLSTGLGISHSIEDHLPAVETLDNLTSKFADFNGNILNIILAIEGILNVQDTSSMDEKTARLHSAIRSSLLLTTQEDNVTREHLREFCLTNRNMLREALTKFSQLAQLLDACKNTQLRIAN